MELRKLNWDSDFFELPVYALEVSTPVKKADVKRMTGTEEDVLLYVYLKEENAELHDQLVSQDALFYDTRIIFSKDLNSGTRCMASVRIDEYSGAMNNELRNLAIEAGTYSRFNTDPRLKPYYEGLYTTWVLNSLNGELADKVFVHEEEGRIDGFATCALKGKEGWTGLISVSPKSQGRGVGTSLMASIENYYIEKHIERSMVITQEDNLKACRFYETCGYMVSQREFIYHWWI